MKMHSSKLLSASLMGLLSLAAIFPFSAQSADPIRALMITGGCCHDYQNQKKIISEGISARANVTWTIVHEGNEREHVVSVYTNANWAKDFDVVVHNECFGTITNAALIDGVVAAHTNGVAAVMIHCAMHTFREAKSTDEWRKLIGVTSFRHGAQHAFEIENIKSEHPVMKGFPAKWQNSRDELYQIVKTWPDCVPLGKAVSATEREQTVIWVNTYGKSRVFGTTLGHNNATVESPVYLDLLTRGLLWSCGKLGEDGKPLSGFGK
jgi:type 1 glutamine amidotransferase